MSVHQPASRLPVPAAPVPPPASARPSRVARAFAGVSPLLRASVGAAAVGLVVEYGVRALLAPALASVRRSDVAPAQRPAAATRVVVTELVIRERVRRFR